MYMVHSGSVKRGAGDDSTAPPRKRAAVDGIMPNPANGN